MVSVVPGREGEEGGGQEKALIRLEDSVALAGDTKDERRLSSYSRRAASSVLRSGIPRCNGCASPYVHCDAASWMICIMYVKLMPFLLQVDFLPDNNLILGPFDLPCQGGSVPIHALQSFSKKVVRAE